MRVSYNGIISGFQPGDVGSIPTIRSNKETTPELVSAYPDSREVKLPDGCVTPWTIMT